MTLKSSESCLLNICFMNLDLKISCVKTNFGKNCDPANSSSNLSIRGIGNLSTPFLSTYSNNAKRSLQFEELLSWNHPWLWNWNTFQIIHNTIYYKWHLRGMVVVMDPMVCNCWTPSTNFMQLVSIKWKSTVEECLQSVIGQSWRSPFVGITSPYCPTEHGSDNSHLLKYPSRWPFLDPQNYVLRQGRLEKVICGC